MAEIHRFKDRAHAGALLARQLRGYAHTPDAIVLALPRGGVPVGFAIAQRLGIRLDVLVVRKLGMPHHEEYAMGAVGSGGVRVLQPGVPGLMGVTAQDIEAVTARAGRARAPRTGLPRHRGRCSGRHAHRARPARRHRHPGRRRYRDRFDGGGGDPGTAPHAAAQAGAGGDGRAAGDAAQACAPGRRAGLPVGAAAVPLGRTVVRRVRADQRRTSTGAVDGRAAAAGGVPSTNRRTEP